MVFLHLVNVLKSSRWSSKNFLICLELRIFITYLLYISRCDLRSAFSLMFALQEAEAELFKGINGDKEQLSQHEYMRGISAWNFDLEALRRQEIGRAHV